MRQAYIDIHHALHSDVAVVTIGGVDYPIVKHPNGCRYVTFEGIKVMQQNKTKSSSFAARARAGEKISWAMTTPTWTLIDDAAINLFSQKVEGITKNSGDANLPTKQLQPGTTTTAPEKRILGAGDYRTTRNIWRQKS